MPKTEFVCQQCGWSSPKWQGQCGGCGQWNSLIEEIRQKSSSKAIIEESVLVSLAAVKPLTGERERISTGMGELDRVLGGEGVGGLVRGSVVLLGGSPGVGKSTLITQVVINLLKVAGHSKASVDNILYIAGEESPEQISLRINRIIGNEQKNSSMSMHQISQDVWAEKLIFLPTHDIEQIIDSIKTIKPSLVVVDSIQTIVTTELSGSAGSIGQVRECADQLTNVAKTFGIPIFVIGHITKEGKLAGPMVLEHIVDVVLEMSGETQTQLRLIRTKKNRFGSTDEVGVFQMGEKGLMEMSDPSLFFLDGADQPKVGAVSSCVVEGTRPLLVEVQALVVPSKLAIPRRVARGISATKLQLICAVLEKHCRLPLGNYDVYVSLAGGLSSTDPGLDLAVVVAVASSYFNKPINPKLHVVGEVGLLGEVRPASLLARRIKEAERLGLSSFIKSTNSRKPLVEIMKLLRLQ